MRVRQAFLRAGSPDRLTMVHLEDAHGTRHLMLFRLTLPLHAAQLFCLLIYLPTEEARPSGRRIWSCAGALHNTDLEALLNEAHQVRYGIVDLLDSDRWSRVSSRDLLEARTRYVLDGAAPAIGGDP